ncbi:MAG: hypothetical protein K8J09_03270 [Planctomycetes bacterium]|nr:hypothetical protein [Planctomycetota bacterium]
MRAPSLLVIALAGLVVSWFSRSAWAQQGSPPPVPLPPAAGAGEASAPVVAATAPSRDELTNKIAELLRDTAHAGPTAFTEVSDWESAMRRPNPNPGSPAPLRTTRGVFSQDQLQLEQSGDESLRVVAVGRGFVVKSGDGAWQLAGCAGRALRIQLSDPLLLLCALAEQLTPVLERSLGEKDGQVVETCICVLARPQIDALVAAGVFSEPNPANVVLQQVRRRGRTAPVDSPPDEVDVRIDIDVRSRAVVAVSLRAITKSVDLAEELLRARRQQMAAVAAEESAPPQPTRTFTFCDGWPVRETEGLEVRTIYLRLHDHGRAALPPLDAEAKRLLGR